MTALADQLAANGRYDTVAIADLAITAGQVTRDANGMVRCAGCQSPILADQASAAQVSGLTLVPGYAAIPARGQGANKW